MLMIRTTAFEQRQASRLARETEREEYVTTLKQQLDRRDVQIENAESDMADLKLEINEQYE